MLHALINWWTIPDVFPRNPQVIVALDYGSRIDKANSAATNKSLLEAIRRQKMFPDATIVFASSSHSFKGSDIVSTEEKKNILAANGVEHYLYAGPIDNSVVEARAVLRELKSTAASLPSELLIICCPFHARSTLFIWQEVFSGARISILNLPHPASQVDHMFGSMRSEGAWLWANIKRQAALRVGSLVLGKKLAFNLVSKAKHKAD